MISERADYFNLHNLTLNIMSSTGPGYVLSATCLVTGPGTVSTAVISQLLIQAENFLLG